MQISITWVKKQPETMEENYIGQNGGKETGSFFKKTHFSLKKYPEDFVSWVNKSAKEYSKPSSSLSHWNCFQTLGNVL